MASTEARTRGANETDSSQVSYTEEKGRSLMSIYKRGDVYWYKFMWQGRLIRESTKQGNDKTARKMEAAHRTRLAEGLVGIREKKQTTLGEFIKNRFEPWAKGRFE